MSTIQLSRNEAKELLRNGYGLSQKKAAGSKSALLLAPINPVNVSPIGVVPPWAVVVAI